MRKRSLWRRPGGAALAIAAVLLLTAGNAVTASNPCKKVSGKFTLQDVSGPACGSAISVCAIGQYSGDINAQTSFTGTAIIPTADTPTTAVILLTGDDTWQTKDGNLLTKDAIVLNTTGNGEFAELDTIVGGTGGLTGASGRITATGTFIAGNAGEGRYNGELCLP